MNDLRDWILSEQKDYSTGVDLYAKYGSNNFLKNRFQRGDKFSMAQKLQYELRQLAKAKGIKKKVVVSVLTTEESNPFSVVTSSIEPAFMLTFKKIKYNSPKVDLYTAASVFPSLTESGRVRFQYDLNTKFEIVKDFYFGINFYFSYDNKPRSITAAKEDYGIIGSLGYSF